ncbi:leucine-rich repeat domain-containing protein, partial [Vibrio parahaemolyticus]
DWCIPLDTSSRVELRSVAESVVLSRNKAQYLGFDDWRLPTIYELSRFEHSKIAEVLESINTNIWTSNASHLGEDEGVLGQLMTTRSTRQSYKDGKIKWSTSGGYAGFEDSYYRHNGQVLLVRGDKGEPQNSWCQKLVEWAEKHDVYEIGPNEESLQYVSEVSSSVKSVIPEFEQLTGLEKLKLYSIDELSESIFKLPKLRSLSLSSGLLGAKQTNILSETISNLTNLVELNIVDCNLNDIHPNLFKLSKLTHLKLARNALTQLPNGLRNLKLLKHLDISVNPFGKIPDDICYLNNLEFLNLTATKLSHVPNNISQLSSLSELKLRNNPLSQLPESLKHLTKLVTLDLADTEIELIPEWITELKGLEKLYLTKSKVRDLPSFLCKCPKLERIIIFNGHHKEFTIAPELEANGITIGKAMM